MTSPACNKARFSFVWETWTVVAHPWQRSRPIPRYTIRRSIIEARVLIWEGDQLLSHAESEGSAAPETATDKYRQAMAVLERVPSEDLTDITTRQAQYLAGVIQRKLGDLPAAAEDLCRHPPPLLRDGRGAWPPPWMKRKSISRKATPTRH